MFMEDVITRLAKVEYVFAGRDRKFIRSVGKRVESGRPLTTRQGWAFLAILRNNQVNAELGMKRVAYDDMIANPQWKQPLVPSVELRSEVRHLGDNMLGFRTSNGRTEIEFSAMKAIYSKGMKIITIENRAALNAAIEFIGKWDFQMDSYTEQFLADSLLHADADSQAVIDGDNLIIDVPNAHVFAQFAHHVLGGKFL